MQRDGGGTSGVEGVEEGTIQSDWNMVSLCLVQDTGFSHIYCMDEHLCLSCLRGQSFKRSVHFVWHAASALR